MLYVYLLMILFFVFCIGTVIGSFLNVVILRAFSGESIVLPPSKCPKCGNKLKWWHNIPIISYILLRGKCYFCHEKISIQYPIIEFITGLVFLAVFIKFGRGEGEEKIDLEVEQGRKDQQRRNITQPSGFAQRNDARPVGAESEQQVEHDCQRDVHQCLLFRKGVFHLEFVDLQCPGMAYPDECGAQQIEGQPLPPSGQKAVAQHRLDDDQQG